MGRVKGNQQGMVTPRGQEAVTSPGLKLLGRKLLWNLGRAGVAGSGRDMQTTRVGEPEYISLHPPFLQPSDLPTRAKLNWM